MKFLNMKFIFPSSEDSADKCKFTLSLLINPDGTTQTHCYSSAPIALHQNTTCIKILHEKLPASS